MVNKETEKLITEIRSKYESEEKSPVDKLKELDRKVHAPAEIATLVFGIVSALIAGFGMSLVMTDIGTFLGIENGLVPGIVIGVIGLFMAIINYPIFAKKIAANRKKYAEEIIKLSDSILNK